MKALTLDTENRTATVSSLPMPTPGANELLIAVKAIALNPVDALYTLQPLGSTGRIVGSDFAGLVVARGPPAPPSNDEATISGGGGPSRLSRSSTAMTASINRGDRVAGFLQGACSVNERPGAFAEYVVCPADLVWRIPGHVTFEEAASVSLCALTAAQGLFFRLGLDAPFQWDPSDTSKEGVGSNGELLFFVFGASTSVGMYVAQLVHRSVEMSGRRVRLIGAASPRNWDLLKGDPYRYDVLVDYRDTSWPEQVREASGGGVHFAYDAISEGSTVRDVSSTLGRGGKMAVVRSREAGAWDPEGVTAEPIYGAVWEGLGEDVQYHKFVVKTSPAKRSFATAFYKWLSDGGILQPNPARIMPGSLHKIVEDGFSLLGTGVSDRGQGRMEDHMRPISAEKLVYRVETERRGSRGEGHIV
ncbi:chaperonin 10-like protein [Mycena sanguinolenta]|nr:chaperonin 10-like protein [Mycena sanguinolenta]